MLSMGILPIIKFTYYSLSVEEDDYQLNYFGSIRGDFGDYKIKNGSLIFQARLRRNYENNNFELYGKLRFLEPFVFTLEEVNETTVYQAMSATMLGQQIYVCPISDFPQIKWPLVWIDIESSNGPYLIFKGEQFDFSLGTYEIYLIGFNMSGGFVVYKENPATGELIPQE